MVLGLLRQPATIPALPVNSLTAAWNWYKNCKTAIAGAKDYFAPAASGTIVAILAAGALYVDALLFCSIFR